jgi:hypothetical protein
MVAQQSMRYSRALIDLTGQSAQQLVSLGIDITHGKLVENRAFISEFSAFELSRIEAAGLPVEILIEDVKAHYKQQNNEDRTLLLDCARKTYDYSIPEHFYLGSTAGYFTYQEMLDILDEMAINYPWLITVKQQVGNTETYGGNRIFWVKISDNPDADEDEPEILYTSLHHAREPISLSQLIYYMWYLLEGYETNAEIKYLVDHTEMYFIPCINPDGYIYNETMDPEGGGMWRKNLRDNDENEMFEETRDGVDLNRNYGFNWGVDNEGSSPNFGSETYRGPSEFSEPETQAIRDFVNEHDFKLALNYHAFGNYLLFPWGFSSEVTGDSLIFNGFAEAMTRENDFKAGTGLETVGYPTNGDSDDWMYGEEGILAFTPELGDDGLYFWPPQDAIIQLCQSTLAQNLTASLMMLNFGIVTENSNDYVSGFSGSLEFLFKRYGLEEGSFTLTVEALSSNITEIEDEVILNPGLFEEQYFEVLYALDPSALPGDQIEFLIKLDNQSITFTDTIRKTYGDISLVLDDEANTTQFWDLGQSEGWGITQEYYRSEPNSITDSPGANYNKNAQNILALKEVIDLSSAEEAVIEFWARWDIEELIDYVVFQASTDNENWTNLCGSHAKPGSIFQLPEEPVYEGLQYNWVKESIDLEDYIGHEVSLRFLLVSDGFNEKDGFYLDDIRVSLFQGDLTHTIGFKPEDFQVSSFPNPASNTLQIEYQYPFPERYRTDIQITNSSDSFILSQWESSCIIGT